MLDISPSGCKTQELSEFYRHPGLTLSTVGICAYNPNGLYSEKISHRTKMEIIKVGDELYRCVASHTLRTGESASDILRRILKLSAVSRPATSASKTAPTPVPTPAVKTKPANPAKDKARIMCGLSLSDEYAEQKRAVNRLMLVLTTLYSLDSKASAEVTESLHGRMCVYLVEDVYMLLKSGNQTKPRQVLDTPWWVITNTNTGRKRNMIEHIMRPMQSPMELTEKVCGTIQPFSICTRRIR